MNQTPAPNLFAILNPGMGKFLLKLALCIGLVLVVGGAQLALGQAEDWSKYRSENFVVYTPSSAGKARKVLQHLERIRLAYTFMLDVELGGSDPVYVVLFKDHKEYLNYSRTALSAAYYTQARGRDFIVISDFTPQVERTMNHEYFHLYAQHQNVKLPPWANEGFADYFSTLQISGRHLEVGHPIAGHMRYLANAGNRLSAEALFSMTAEERHTAGKEAVGDLYSMSWALVHLIFSDPEHQDKTSAMVAALQRTEDASVAFGQVYGWTVDEVEEYLLEYVRRRTMGYMRMDLPERLVLDAATEVAEIAPWAAPLLLADLMTFSRHAAEAESAYVQLSELYPDVAGIDDSLAHLHMINRQQEAAGPFLRSAIAKGSTSPDTYKYFVYGQCQGGAVSDECLEIAKKAARMAPDDKQLQFLAMHVAMRAEKFVDALLIANTLGSVTAEEAGAFFYEVAYCQYRLDMTEEAKKSIAKALEYEGGQFQRARLQELQASLDGERTAGIAQSNERPDIKPSKLASSEPRVLQTSVESIAQRLINSFAASEDQLVVGAIRELNCAAEQPILTIEIDGTLMPLIIDDPAQVSIIRNGQIVDDYQFTCGVQSGEPLRVGFELPTAGQTGGLLRLLQFGSIE